LYPAALRRVASQNNASLFAMKRHNTMSAAALRDTMPQKMKAGVVFGEKGKFLCCRFPANEPFFEVLNSTKPQQA